MYGKPKNYEQDPINKTKRKPQTKRRFRKTRYYKKGMRFLLEEHIRQEGPVLQ